MDIVQKKRKQSMTMRFLSYIIITILASNLLLFAVNYTVMTRALVKRAVESSQNMLENNLEVMNQHFADIDHIADSIIYNTELINVLKSPNDTVAGMDLLRSIERIYYHSRRDLHLTFYKASAPSKAYSIYINNEQSEFKDYRGSKWYRLMGETGEDRAIVTNIYSDYPDGQENTFVHSIVYRIRDAYGDAAVGYLKIDLDLKSLKNRLILGYKGIKGISILGQDNEVLFYDKTPLKLPEERLGSRLIPGTVYHYETGSEIVSYGISEKTGWKLVLSVSKASLYKDMGYISAAFTIALFGAILVAVIICWKFSALISKNFRRLIDGMNAVKSGDLQIQVEQVRDDEIGQLVSEFNDMVKKVDELMLKVEKNQELLNEAEIKALQQQINPHFIYNTLETMMGLAAEGMTDEIIEVGKCMSAMLRYNTRLESRTTIEQEIRQVQNFVRVLLLRFEGCFKAVYDIDDNCLNGVIVKFALQPLVENAVGHGLSNTTSNGRLLVAARRFEDKVLIIIEDNGRGMMPNRLKELHEKINHMDEDPLRFMDQHDGTGLLNVHLRLKLYFEDAYHMDITSSPGEGTSIRIEIPYVDQETGERRIPGRNEVYDVQSHDRGR